MSQLNYFGRGLRAGVPIMLGYIPVAMAFGIAGSSLGLSATELIATSLIVYAGAGQFFILASLQLGTPLATMVMLVTLLNARHLLYGPIIEKHLPKGLKNRLLKAFYLTDEVFATCYVGMGKVEPPARSSWYMGLGLLAWLSWASGTAIGVFAGDELLKAFPVVEKTLGFALPAMFVAVTVQSIQSHMLKALLAGVLVTLVVVSLGYPTLAILVGAFGVCLFYAPGGEDGKA
ncbi:MAG: branched-chain amino acid ABC transporter permease [Alcaligenaceae bacterium]|nr:branched-chain amino acid ABC transporter permease [Alcaligenaceae bacterium]